MTDKNGYTPNYCAFGRDPNVSTASDVCYGTANTEGGVCVHHRDLAGTKEEVRAQTIWEIATWIRSSTAGGLYGSESWALRHRLAEVIESRAWETTLRDDSQDRRPASLPLGRK